MHPYGMQGRVHRFAERMHALQSNATVRSKVDERAGAVQRNGLGVALQGNAEGGGGRALRSNATSGPCPSLHPVGMHGNALGVALQGNARLRGASAPLLHCLLHRFAMHGRSPPCNATPCEACKACSNPVSLNGLISLP